VITIHLPDNFDHAVHGSKVAAPHGAVRDEERLAQSAQLQGDELRRGFRLVPRQRLADEIARALDREPLALRDLVNRNTRVEEIDDPALARGLGGARFAARPNGSVAAGRRRRGVARTVCRQWSVL
jgi:hypothetical protein